MKNNDESKKLIALYEIQIWTQNNIYYGSKDIEPNCSDWAPRTCLKPS